MSTYRTDIVSVSIRLVVGVKLSFTRPNAAWDQYLATNLIHYLPVITTMVAVGFFRVLWRQWRRNPSARYMMWRTIGVGRYGLGTLIEALTTIFGWKEPVFRTWYVARALPGAGPLAQDTVYLLLPKRTADRLTVAPGT